MIKRSAGRLVLTCLIISMLVLGLGISVMAVPYVEMLSLGGDEATDPLFIEVYDNGRIGFYFWQYEYGDPENELIWQNQYYGDDCWGTNIFLEKEGQGIYYTTDYYISWFTSPGIDVGNGTLEKTGNTIRAVWELEEGDITFEQLVTYVPGSYMYEKVFRLTNNTSDVDYANLKLIHGGDTYFGGDDSARSYWNEALNMIFLRNADMDLYGIMGYAGTSGTPADHYFGGNYSEGGVYAVDGQLPDIADSDYRDAGYQLQWNRPALAPGETWVIRSYELITEPNALQIITPAEMMADPCEVLQYTFSLFNFSEDERTVDLSAVSASGWLAEIIGDAQIVLDGNGGSADITVQLTVPCDAVSLQSDILTLTATDANNSEIFVTGSTRTTVRQQPPRIVSVVPEKPVVYAGTASIQVDVVTADLAEGGLVFLELLDKDMNPQEPAVSAQGSVDADGKVRIALALPAGLPVADYLIQATLEEEASAKTAELAVVARPVILSVAPAVEEVTQGETSLEIMIETGNAPQGTEVTVVVLDEDGNPLDPAVTGSGTVDAAGKVVITLTLPADMPLGMYNLLVSMADAEDDTSAWFEVIAELEPIPQTGATSPLASMATGMALLVSAGFLWFIRRKLICAK